MLIIIYITYFNNIENITKYENSIIMQVFIKYYNNDIFFLLLYLQWDNEMNEINIFKSSVFLI